MSRVTTVLLYVGLDDDLLPAVNARLLELGGACADGQARYQLCDLTDGPWGGTKAPDTLYGGAFNHFDLYDLGRALCPQPWADRGLVRVLILDEEERYGELGVPRLMGLNDFTGLQPSIGAELTAVDPQPAVDSVVRDSNGKLWHHADEGFWLGVDYISGSDPESWETVAGGCGPVTMTTYRF